MASKCSQSRARVNVPYFDGFVVGPANDSIVWIEDDIVDGQLVADKLGDCDWHDFCFVYKLAEDVQT